MMVVIADDINNSIIYSTETLVNELTRAFQLIIWWLIDSVA